MTMAATLGPIATAAVIANSETHMAHLRQPTHASPAPANKFDCSRSCTGQSSPADRATVKPKDAVEHAPVIYRGHAARLVRQERLSGYPFIVGKFVAHGSRPCFGSLNHGLPTELRFGSRYGWKAEILCSF